jgi:serine/threonine protein kinase
MNQVLPASGIIAMRQSCCVGNLSAGEKLVIGSVVGNYKILEKIGEGGMGAVFRAIDFMIDREVALKVLRPELAGQPAVVERFRLEAKALARLDHPNIATLYGFFRREDDFFMVMEYVRGETLASLIGRSGALAPQVALSLFCQMLEGIGYAHSQMIVHRDIKPPNVMLTDRGTIKLTDFGIARFLGSDRLTQHGMVVGTFEYMSPEHILGHDTDPRSDIYSLGVVLYEMLTGRLPFSTNNEYELMKSHVEKEPSPPRSLVSHIPVRMEQATMRALSKDPRERFETASDFQNALLGSATPGPQRAVIPGTRQASSPLVEGSSYGRDHPLSQEPINRLVISHSASLS